VHRDSIPADERRTLTLTIPAVLHERIRAYRAAKRLDSEEEAVRWLIERALDEDAADPTAIKVDLGLREDRD
jgi:hypothetical protein